MDRIGHQVKGEGCSKRPKRENATTGNSESRRRRWFPQTRWRCGIFLRSSTSKTRPSEGGPASTGRWAKRLPRQRKPRDRQGPRDRGASQKGRGARARERTLKKFPGFLEPGPCARHGFLKAHRDEFGPIGGCELHCPSMRPNSSDMLIVAAAAALSAGLPPATSGRFRGKRTPILPWVSRFWAVFDGVVRCRLRRPGKRRRVVVFRAGSVCETVQRLQGVRLC